MHSWPFSLKENGAAINPPLHSNREIALIETAKTIKIGFRWISSSVFLNLNDGSCFLPLFWNQNVPLFGTVGDLM
jgi:hypothetical protein